MIAKAIIASIRVYQHVGALLCFRCCRFSPTCSQYTVEAITKHGIIKGCSMGFVRVLRCSPLSKGGYDPIR